MAIEEDWARAGYTATLPCQQILDALAKRWPGFKSFFAKSTEEPPSFDAYLERLREHYRSAFDDDDPEEEAFPFWSGMDHTGSWETLAFNMAITNCIKAFAADEAGKHHLAWAAAFDASHWEGFLTGRFTSETRPTTSVTETRPTISVAEMGRRGGLASTADSSSMKKEVKAWCEMHLSDGYESLNELADAAVAAKINVTPRSTIRRDLSVWAKVWRADGRWTKT